MFAREGMDVVIARIFNVMGRAVTVNLSIGKFAFELASIKKHRKRPVLYTKSLDMKRDFLDINDVCEYLLAIAFCGEQGEIYNICRGKPYKIRGLLNKLIGISGIKDIRIIENKNIPGKDNPAGSYG